MAGLVLFQPEQHHVSDRGHPQSGRFQRLPRALSISHEEMRHADSADHPGPAAFHAHARGAQRFAHLREGSGPVLQFDREVFHAGRIWRAFTACTAQRFDNGRTVTAEPDVARLARTLGEPSRLRILTLLLDGRAATAKELAYGAGVSPATGTTHLHRLVRDHLIVSRAQGRHKYFQLASPDVARCVESLLTVAPVVSAVPSRVPHPLREARYCYDHLAGRLAVAITQGLLDRRLLVRAAAAFAPTPRGEAWFARFGLDLAALRATRRQFAPLCMDWSERKDHLGGVLGAALAQQLEQNRWIKRRRDSRAVIVTPTGAKALAAEFGWSPAEG